MKSVYIVNIHRYGYKAGKRGKIIGIKWITPKGLEPRICYEVLYGNVVDFTPIDDKENYRLITKEDELPKIIN